MNFRTIFLKFFESTSCRRLKALLWPTLIYAACTTQAWADMSGL